MLENFDAVGKSQSLVDLSFDDLLSLIKDDNLVVSSENVAVDAIMRWVSPNPSSAEDGDLSEEGYMRGNKDTKNLEQESEHVSKESQDCRKDNDGNKPQRSETNACGAVSAEQEEEKTPGNAQRSSCFPLKDEEDGDQCLTLPESSMAERKDVEKHKMQKEESTLFPNEGREQYLLQLLSATRLCLASPDCLKNLFEHSMIMDVKESRDIVLEAAYYQMQIGQRHGQWPEAARHRRHSDLENVLIWISAASTYVYRFVDKAHYSLADDTFQWTGRPSLTTFNNKLYGVSTDSINLYNEGGWTRVFNGPGYKCMALSHEGSIYLFNKTSAEVKSFNPELLELQQVMPFPGTPPITSAVSVKDKILVFNKETRDEEELTGVHCFDAKTETWVKLEDIKGPAEKLISFCVEKNTYLLQTNGNLWAVINASRDVKDVQINFCRKIWDFKLDLGFAAVFKDTLFLSCVLKEEHNNRPCTIPGIIEHVKYVSFTGVSRLRFAPGIMPKKYFGPPK